MRKTCIYNCDLLSFEGDQPQIKHNYALVISGNSIESLAPVSDRPVQEDEMRIDATGLLAIPGMINTHAHVPMVLFRNLGPDVNANDWFNKVIFPLESNLTPEDVYWGAMLGMAEMIAAGITTVADHYFEMDHVARAIESSGMRANLAWAVFSHQGYAQLDRTLEFIERWQGKADGRITTWLGPHSPYLCEPDFLRRCAQEADRLGVGNHIHVSETREQVALSLERYGRTPVELLDEVGILDHSSIFAHCLYPTESDLKLMQGRPLGIAQAPKTYLAMAMGIGDLPAYTANGIPLALAADGAVSSTSLDLFEQMRLTALTQKDRALDATVFPVAETLKMAFLGGAKVIRNPRLGNLQPGMLADLVLLRQDRPALQPLNDQLANLVYNHTAQDVDTVVCDGKVLYQHGKHLTLDLPEILKEVNARLPRLLTKDLNRKIADYPA